MPTVVPPHVVILATSLNPESRSGLLAERALTVLKERHPAVAAELIDLRAIGPLPLAGSPEAYAAAPHPAVDHLRASFRAATHILIAVPIYNFSGSAAAKNVIELMGDADLGGRIVGFLCSAGGPRSYMSVLSLANSLMLDFRCWIVPRFVYATGSDFKDGVVAHPDVVERIEQIIDDMLRHGPLVP